MDQKQAQNINQASEELTDSSRQAFQMLADRTVSLQESNLRLTQNFFQNWISSSRARPRATARRPRRFRSRASASSSVCRPLPRSRPTPTLSF
jgi:hypothetical protein